MRSPRRESLCYGQISGCRGANRKNRRNNWPILRWDQLSFWWFVLDRQEESGKVAHLAGRKPICATNYTNVIQIIVLDYIRLIGRQNWITFGPNECGGKEGSYTIKKPTGADGKNLRTRGGITGPYYGGMNCRFVGSCWTASNCAPWQFSVIRSRRPILRWDDLFPRA